MEVEPSTFYLYTYIIWIFATDVFAFVIKYESINEEHGVDRFKAYEVWQIL